MVLRTLTARSMTKSAADDPREPRQQREAPKRHAPSRKASARAKAPREATAPPGPPDPGFERGALVRVIRGPFAGKTGVVQELVGRRSARVMLGLLPVQIGLEDLAPNAPNGAARPRPRLASSHRKPVPARS
jgi:transcription antitermination factor NusG